MKGKIDFAYTPVFMILFLFLASLLPMPWAIVGGFAFYGIQQLIGAIKPIGRWIRENKKPEPNIDKAVKIYIYANAVFFTYMLFQAMTWSWIEIGVMSLLWGVMTGSVGLAAAHEAVHRKGWMRQFSAMHIMYSQYYLQHRYHHKHYGTEKDSSWPPVGRNFYKHLLITLPGKQREAHSENPKEFWICMVLNCVYPLIAFLIGPKALAFLFLNFFVMLIMEEAENYTVHYGMTRDMPEGYSSWSSTKEIFNICSFNLGPHEEHHKTGRSNYEVLYKKPVAMYPTTHYEGVLACLWPPYWFSIAHPKMKALFRTQQSEGLKEEDLPESFRRELEKIDAC